MFIAARFCFRKITLRQLILNLMTQISTSVQQTTEVVRLKAAVLTPWEALSVAVIQDTQEMESLAWVRQFQRFNIMFT